VLFTDLVGSTDLMTQVGEPAFDKLRRAHFAALRAAIARTGGDEIKTTGDGVMVVFGSAAEAVDCAVAMQQAVDRQARTSTAPLAMRVGVALGDVTFEDDDVFGTPVVEAARLVAAARNGQILATSVVQVVAGGRTAAFFVDLGRLELKGLPQSIPVCEVGWEPLPQSPVPLPALLTDIGRIFVGREHDVERLEQLWKEAAAGEVRVALLAGEPGVGKTRLAGELAGTVHAEGGAVLAGRCDEDLGVPYQPFLEALRYFVEHVPPDGLREGLGRHGGELVRLVPELGERLRDLPAPLRSDPETERYRLFDAVAAWLASASGEAPLLLVLDDLQWAAKPTLLLLRHVVRSPEPKRLLVVATYRDTELDHDHPLLAVLADLRRQGSVERFSLLGLDQSGVAAFVAQASGQALDDDALSLARAIHLETEGNPFFVREVLRHLTETQAVVRRGDVWSTRLPVEELGIPEGVREVVGKRLARLSEEANRVLRMAAVVGAEFEPELVRAAGAFDEEELISALEEATAARLVIESASRRYRFAHALVRDTLYNGLSAMRRVALHRRVAEGIEAIHAATLDDHLPALAHHWARASAPAAETHKAVAYATRAGGRALAQLAHDEAATYYRQALDLLPADGEADGQHVELLISLGEAQRRAGDPSHRDTLLEAAQLARQRDDADALGRAALANTRGHLTTNVGIVDDAKVAMLEAAIAAVGDRALPSRARLLATLGLELVFSGDWRRCLALSDEALALARSLNDPETLASVLVARFFPAQVPDLLEERLANTAELLTAAEAASDPALATTAHLLRGRAAFEASHLEEAQRSFDTADRLSAELGQPALRYRVVYPLASWHIALGRFPEAERLISEAREMGHASGQPEADRHSAWQLWCLGFAQGRLDDEVISLLEAEASRVHLPMNDSLLALAACEMGRDHEARAALDRHTSTPVPFNLWWLLATTNWAAVAAHLGDTTHAERLAALLRPYAGQAVPLMTLPTPCVAHSLGLLSTTLGRYDEAETWFPTAAATHERLGAAHWLTLTRLEWARMLLARRATGDAERARELLGQALLTARELGLEHLERRAVALLE
jgi:class 3 adenylate cyclase/tetratricopeptide (TPR) repeat protein